MIFGERELGTDPGAGIWMAMQKRKQREIERIKVATPEALKITQTRVRLNVPQFDAAFEYLGAVAGSLVDDAAAAPGLRPSGRP